MTQQELKRLRAVNEYPSISIITPTHRSMPQKEQDPIRIKNLVNQAKDRILKEFQPADVAHLLKNLDKLVDNIDYEHTLDSLLLFVNKTGANMYTLPITAKEQIVIDSKLELRDLERYLNRTFNYWVLALSEKPTRLFMGRGNTLVEVFDTQVGKDQEGPYPPLWEYDVIEPWSGFPYQHNYDVHSDRDLLAVGTGDKDSKYLDELKHGFFEDVDTLLGYHLAPEPKAPLIVLGTPENVAYFKETSKHKDLIIGSYHGDYNRVPFTKIEEVVEPILKDYITQKKEHALQNFKESIGTLHHAFGFDWVWRVAQEGRIKTLLVEENYQVSGAINDNIPTNVIEYTNPNEQQVTEDLVDNLINIVLDKKGEVIFFKPDTLKDYKHIAAILRY